MMSPLSPQESNGGLSPSNPGLEAELKFFSLLRNLPPSTLDHFPSITITTGYIRDAISVLGQRLRDEPSFADLDYTEFSYARVREESEAGSDPRFSVAFKGPKLADGSRIEIEGSIAPPLARDLLANTEGITKKTRFITVGEVVIEDDSFRIRADIDLLTNWGPKLASLRALSLDWVTIDIECPDSKCFRGIRSGDHDLDFLKNPGILELSSDLKWLTRSITMIHIAKYGVDIECSKAIEELSRRASSASA
ncbi:MAG: hypothetical protein KDD42_06385 [Bdellovibrionales bacterium]|nr:hypothetical protein [Bdellovibrionales bacterium]